MHPKESDLRYFEFEHFVQLSLLTHYKQSFILELHKMHFL